MRLKMFLLVALAVVASAGSYLDLAARCRCDRPARGERKAARQEKRSARRGYSSYSPSATPSTPSTSPYDSGVQPLGASAPAYRWECNGRSCRLVPATTQSAAADCPPPTAPTKTPEPESPKAEAQEVRPIPPELNPAEFETPIDPTTTWRPDPVEPQKLPGWDD